MPLLTWLELALGLAAVALALWTRPWRMLSGPLLTPALASVALLPWLWLLPQKLPQGLPLYFSGACLVLLMLGWPLAVLSLALIASVVWWLGDLPWPEVLKHWVWLGLLPATLALFLGLALRRWLPPNLFIYTLGRGFLGTALSVFVAGVLFESLHHGLGGSSLHEALVARWLMAWGEAFLTGIFAAVFVAFAPQWLATWSDARYLKPPSG